MAAGTHKPTRKPSTRKRMIIMLVLVGVLIALVVGFNVFKSIMIGQAMQQQAQSVETVSAAEAAYAPWQPSVSAIGTLRAARGADLSFEVGGVIDSIEVESGAEVDAGDVLVTLRNADEAARVEQLAADAALAEVTFRRAQEQRDVEAISAADFDTAQSQLAAARAALAEQRALLAQTRLIAPFDGRIGIVTLNEGNFVEPGTAVVTLQQLDPIFVDFAVPQRELPRLRVGQAIELRLEGRDVAQRGEITAIDPRVETSTRNVRVEARAANAEAVLLPGMFVQVSVQSGEAERYLTLPQTAVSYNPYGSTVFVLVQGEQARALQRQIAAQQQGGGDATADEAEAEEAAEQAPETQPLPEDAWVAQQRFVTTGPTRGDQIAILDGIEEGEMIVTSGQLKLRNGSVVRIDNSVQPANDPSPRPQEGADVQPDAAAPAAADEPAP